MHSVVFNGLVTNTVISQEIENPLFNRGFLVATQYWLIFIDSDLLYNKNNQVNCMSYKKSLFTALFVVFCLFALNIPTVSASGLKLVKSGDAYYLSTTEEDGTTTYREVDPTSTISAQTATTNAATDSGGLFTPVRPSTGYIKDIGSLINFILQIVIVLALLLVFFNLIMAGLQWITSGGDKGKIDAARQRIISAIVGILVLSAAYATAQLVAYILGFESFNEIFWSIKRINP